MVLPKTELERIHVGSCDSPLGGIWLATSDSGVLVVTVPGATRDDCLNQAFTKSRGTVEFQDGGEIVGRAIRQLTAYFAGTLQRFNLPLDLRGTKFQRLVWNAVYHVPYGATVTYRDIANQIDAPRGYRAVGAANGANPVAIIVPCHRIVGVSGSLRGYGGGLHQKQALLDHEAAHRDEAP